jgi:hypothetical protein
MAATTSESFDGLEDMTLPSAYDLMYDETTFQTGTSYELPHNKAKSIIIPLPSTPHIHHFQTFCYAQFPRETVYDALKNFMTAIGRMKRNYMFFNARFPEPHSRNNCQKHLPNSPPEWFRMVYLPQAEGVSCSCFGDQCRRCFSDAFLIGLQYINPGENMQYFTKDGKELRVPLSYCVSCQRMINMMDYVMVADVMVPRNYADLAEGERQLDINGNKNLAYRIAKQEAGESGRPKTNLFKSEMDTFQEAMSTDLTKSTDERPVKKKTVCPICKGAVGSKPHYGKKCPLKKLQQTE